MPYQPTQPRSQSQTRPDSGKFDLLNTGSIQSTNLRNLQQLSLNPQSLNAQSLNSHSLNAQHLNGANQEPAPIEPVRKAPQVPDQKGGQFIIEIFDKIWNCETILRVKHRQSKGLN